MQLDEKSCKNSLKLFNYFEKKFNLGSLGLFEAVSIASITTKTIRPLSVLVVSPSGHFKSSLQEDLLKIFPKQTKLMPSWFTDYGIMREFSEVELDNKIWCFNDLVSTFGSLSQTKANRVASFLAELLSEGHTGAATYQGKKELNIRIGLIGNIAYDMWRKRKVDFLISTFNERLIEFHYALDWNEVETDRSLKPPKIKVSSKKVVLSEDFKLKVKNIGKKLQMLRNSSSLPRNVEFVESFVCSHANLNSRTIVVEEDFIVFEQLMSNFKALKKRFSDTSYSNSNVSENSALFSKTKWKVT